MRALPAGRADEDAVSLVPGTSRHRHPRHRLPELTVALRAAFAAPTLLMAGAAAVGDPVAVLPVLFHLLWRHELVTG